MRCSWSPDCEHKVKTLCPFCHREIFGEGLESECCGEINKQEEFCINPFTGEAIEDLHAKKKQAIK